jgi:hypothetical protein
MDALARFTAADVPALGPAEAEVAPGKWTNSPTPAGLPGKGLGQHPMLYIGEGYNKMFVINDGKIIWTYSTGKGNEYDDAWMLSNGRYPIKSPWAAIRLKNGNTLITDENDKLTREVNSKGETVWELGPDDLPEQYRFINTQTCTRLANGNTIICSRGGNGKGPQLVEVTPDKKVAWVLQDWADLGPATAVQVLDDPGIPENPGESEH